MSSFGRQLRSTGLIGMLFCICGAGLAQEPDSVRLGWQIPWATQGQLVMALKHSNIPEMVNLTLRYVGFSYGAPLNQAAAAGEVDVLLTADQPAIALIANSRRFKIVARMMYNRVCLYVPPVSKIQAMQDLGGGTIMGPVGAAAERVALARLAATNVDLKSLRLGSLDMLQQVALLKRDGGKASWNGVDALYGFDPFPAAFEQLGLARMLNCDNVTSVVVASNELIAKRRPALEKFLQAFALAWTAYAAAPARLDGLFLRESRLEFSEQALQKSASVEPNRFAGGLSEMRLEFVPEDIKSLEAARDFLWERKLITEKADIEMYLDLAPLRSALASFPRHVDAAKIAIRQ